MALKETAMPTGNIAWLFQKYLENETYIEQEKEREEENERLLQQLENQINGLKGLVDASLVDEYHAFLTACNKQSDQLEHCMDLLIHFVSEIWESLSPFGAKKIRVVTDHGHYMIICDQKDIGFRWCRLANGEDDGSSHPPLTATLGLEDLTGNT